MLGARQIQLLEEDLRQLVVVVLAGVDEHLGRPLPQPVRDRRRLHELRPVAYDREYTHENGVWGCLDMSVLRGTVQGVLAGVGHVLWYVDWHTGGRTTRG
jgi:hypothetical protein